MNHRIKTYYNLIDKINNKIKEIQESCPHDKGFTAGVCVPGGSVKICNECNLVLTHWWATGSGNSDQNALHDFGMETK